MGFVLRAIAPSALPGLALACALWEPPPENYALPPLEFPTPEIDVPFVEIDPGSALWLAKSPIGSLYLFGSAEPTREKGYASFGPAVDRAYAESAEVVYEIDLGALAPEQTVALMKRYGTLKPPATLQSRVSRETWALVEKRFSETGRSTETVQALQPWLVSFALANHMSLRTGESPLPEIAYWAEQRAREARRDAAKPVVGLRTLESLFRAFAALPRGAQESLLRGALGLGAKNARDPQLASASRDRALLAEHLIFRRNEQMAERLFEIAIDGKVRFVAVGILHLLGDRGIPALLAQRGFRVSQVQ